MSCKICKHPSREHIERLRAAGRSLREIADLFDDVNYRTLSRHLKECLGGQIVPKNGLQNNLFFNGKNASFKSMLERVDSGTVSIDSICDTLDDIDLDAKELFLLAKKAKNYDEADSRLHTRMQIQRIKLELAEITMKKRPLKNVTPDGGDDNEGDEGTVEDIPPEIEELIN